MAKFVAPKLEIVPQPNIPSLEEFKGFVAKKVGNTDKAESLAYEELYRKYYDQILVAWNRYRQEEISLTSLPLKIFNKIPIIAAISFDNQPKLIDNAAFRQVWLTLVTEKNDARHARKIYRAVLRNYDSYQPYLEQVFACIKPLIKSASQPLCKKLAALDDRYNLLNPTLIKNITNHIFQHQDKPVDDVLLDMGIAGASREAGIGAVVGKEILAQNYTCLSSNDNSMLAKTFAYFSNATEDTLRLEYLRNELLKSLLGNYLEQDPPAKIKQDIEEFIDRFVGDPRANPNWTGVEERIAQVVMRWKIGVTLKSFFALLDHVARTDSTHDRHWQARKQFWQDYLDRGKIKGAWVVLGKKYFDNQSFFSAGNLKFGKFIAYTGIQSSHCAIIMQVNDGTLTEWSHSGALRIWRKDEEGAPKMYQDTYHPDDLKNKQRYEDGYVVHGGNWQEKAREILEDKTEFRRW